MAKLKERRWAGLDNIPNKLLKMAASIVSPSLTLISAKSIETGIFPEEWKLTRVTPIFKKGKRDDPNNYWLISVIPTVAKIFEKCICDQISEYLNTNNLLSHCKSGFRSLVAGCVDSVLKCMNISTWSQFVTCASVRSEDFPKSQQIDAYNLYVSATNFKW